jgi:transcriptional regulator GlxA family with amidase domain
MGDLAIRDYLWHAADTSQLVGSVYTRAMPPGPAGLPEGRDATTHWSHHRLLERLGAGYLPQRWVEDGKVTTSARVLRISRQRPGGTRARPFLLHFPQ